MALEDLAKKDFSAQVEKSFQLYRSAKNKPLERLLEKSVPDEQAADICHVCEHLLFTATCFGISEFYDNAYLALNEIMADDLSEAEILDLLQSAIKEIDYWSIKRRDEFLEYFAKKP